MNVTIDLAQKHLQDIPNNVEVLRADLMKVIALYQELESRLDNLERITVGIEVEPKVVEYFIGAGMLPENPTLRDIQEFFQGFIDNSFDGIDDDIAREEELEEQ